MQALQERLQELELPAEQGDLAGDRAVVCLPAVGGEASTGL